MTRLSVNINKVALIRNARGGNLPNLKQVAIDIEKFGAHGVTVHPRPDERHIRYDDIPMLKEIVTTEFNIEGNPTPRFMEMVLKHQPHQCTLVPDAPDALTSNAGWDTISNKVFLKEIMDELRNAGIRSSLFVDPVGKMVEGAKEVGADRIELYTGDYAHDFHKDKHKAVASFTKAAIVANEIEIGINAGHDLNLDNLKFFKENIPNLLEVSIGQALITDALYFGFYNTVQLYLRELK